MSEEEISLIRFRIAAYLRDHEEPSSAVAIAVHTHTKETQTKEKHSRSYCMSKAQHRDQMA